MVYKNVISDVGIKFATASGDSSGEIKVVNTLINQWEELTFDFTGKVGIPSSTNIDQIIFSRILILREPLTKLSISTMLLFLPAL
ncbi:hypothetical protein [Flavobacterium sp. 3HN19-14]|uniref:hypothetical protein n=1 Tax=Flavobacterium sp. 3HN19-14 TaxID=3448133 RepID=UPI003EE32B42